MNSTYENRSTHTVTAYRFYIVTNCPGTQSNERIEKHNLHIQNERIYIWSYT